MTFGIGGSGYYCMQTFSDVVYVVFFLADNNGSSIPVYKDWVCYSFGSVEKHVFCNAF